MEIITKSGAVTINKRTAYGKWLIGYTQTKAWTGWYTIEDTWNKNKDKKPDGCSWKAWGMICGNTQSQYCKSRENLNFIKELKEDWETVIQPLLDKNGITLTEEKGLYINKIDTFYNFNHK